MFFVITVDVNFQRESGLGILDHHAITNAVTNCKIQSKTKVSYNKWLTMEKFEIGKYAAQNVHTAAVRKFSKMKNHLMRTALEGSVNFTRKN